MSTISPISSLVCGKPASMILSACRASPTLVSLVSRYFVPTALPIAKDATTNASQPKTAVFQWLALHRPMRAAKLLECLRGDTVSPLRGGLVREDSGCWNSGATDIALPGVSRCGYPHSRGGGERAGDGPCGEHDEAAHRRVEQEVVPGRDDVEEHERRVEQADDADCGAPRVCEERCADDQRVAEVHARDGRERVVEASEQVRAEVHVRVRRHRVDEPVTREARR